MKIGDYVQRKDQHRGPPWDWRNGEFRVMDVSDQGSLNLFGLSGWWFASKFDVIPTPLKVGDWVKRKENESWDHGTGSFEITKSFQHPDGHLYIRLGCCGQGTFRADWFDVQPAPTHAPLKVGDWVRRGSEPWDHGTDTYQIIEASGPHIALRGIPTRIWLASLFHLVAEQITFRDDSKETIDPLVCADDKKDATLRLTVLEDLAKIRENQIAEIEHRVAMQKTTVDCLNARAAEVIKAIPSQDPITTKVYEQENSFCIELTTPVFIVLLVAGVAAIAIIGMM